MERRFRRSFVFPLNVSSGFRKCWNPTHSHFMLESVPNQVTVHELKSVTNIIITKYDFSCPVLQLFYRATFH